MNGLIRGLLNMRFCSFVLCKFHGLGICYHSAKLNAYRTWRVGKALVANLLNSMIINDCGHMKWSINLIAFADHRNYFCKHKAQAECSRHKIWKCLDINLKGKYIGQFIEYHSSIKVWWTIILFPRLLSTLKFEWINLL